VETKVRIVTAALHTAASKAIPKYRTLKKLKKVGRGIWNRNIALTSKESKQLFKRWKDTNRKCEITKRQLKDKKKLLRRYQRQAHANLKHKNINDIMQAVESDDKLFYKLINKQRQTVNENAQTLKVGGRDISKPEEILETWKHHFETLATPSEIQTDENSKVQLAKLQNHEIEKSIITEGEQMDPITPIEVHKAVLGLNSGKAADEEGITCEHLKYAKHETVPVLTDILNSILTNLDIPGFLKCGILTPIHKKGKDKFSPNN
jgi:hypothetical protein